jgi:glycosyltransferase involved in cell wall biosynthesis
LRKKNIIELEKVSVRRSYSRVAHAALRVLKQKIDLTPFDVLVISSEGVGDFFVFRNHSRPIVCYCLTPLKIIHDTYTRARYIKSNPRDRSKYFIFSNLFKFLDKLAWHYYDHVICISEETRSRVLRAGLSCPEKLEVIHPGLDINRMRPSSKFGSYFLIPGRIMWQKNIELGIQAFKAYRQRFAEDKNLVIAGMVDEKSQPYLEKLFDISNGDPGIQFVIDPSDEKLFSLYRESYAVLFTSLNEDWGMVPLEAMGFGKPVVSVNRGGPLESIIQGKTGFLIEPTPLAFAAVMADLSKNPSVARKIGALGAQHVAKFDWSHFVRRFDEALERVASTQNEL